MNNYQRFIHLRTYARWLSDKGRRETWEETVTRYTDYLLNKFSDNKRVVSKMPELHEAILNLHIMPSMRAMHSAGEALTMDNQTAYNCKYQEINTIKSFADVLYSLMCGCGVGFSVQKSHIAKLPKLANRPIKSIDSWTLKVEDSRIGWAMAYEEYLQSLWLKGEYPRQIDVSTIRAAGTPLKTFGGFASGPDVLLNLFEETRKIFVLAEDNLNPKNCLDLLCHIADCVIAGGVRRSAMIALMDYEDAMIAKANVIREPWLYNCNVSAMVDSYEVSPSKIVRLIEQAASHGEPGIIFKDTLKRKAQKSGREYQGDYGVNPCSEVILRSNEFCNLTEVVLRPDDTLEDNMKYVELATILGCLQSCLTDFNFIHSDAKFNCEDERLLGVSLTGIMDDPDFIDKNGEGCAFEALHCVAEETACAWSGILGIKTPKAITTVKPSGTVSQLVNSSSGIHPRYSKYYIRSVQVNKTDPLAKFLIHKGIPHKFPNGTHGNPVFSFPMKAPHGAITKDKLTAKDQMEAAYIANEHWADHNVSVSIYLSGEEVLGCASWLWQHRHEMTALSFFPKETEEYLKTFPWIPYEAITKTKYDDLEAAMPKINWNEFTTFESKHRNEAAKSVGVERALACSGGKCEL